MMRLQTQLVVACTLLIGLTTRATSANTWGRKITGAKNILQRNPWHVYGTSRLCEDDLQSTERIVLQPEYIFSIRGGSSATGKYLASRYLCCLMMNDY